MREPATPVAATGLETAVDGLRAFAALALLSATVFVFASAYEGIIELASGGQAVSTDSSGGASRAENHAPAPGEQIQMVLFVEASPPGAHLFVDAQDKGEVPAIMTLPCRLGEILPIKVGHSGFRPHSVELVCKERDRLEVRLLRAEKKPRSQ